MLVIADISCLLYIENNGSMAQPPENMVGNPPSLQQWYLSNIAKLKQELEASRATLARELGEKKKLMECVKQKDGTIAQLKHKLAELQHASQTPNQMRPAVAGSIVFCENHSDHGAKSANPVEFEEVAI